MLKLSKILNVFIFFFSNNLLLIHPSSILSQIHWKFHDIVHLLFALPSFNRACVSVSLHVRPLSAQRWGPPPSLSHSIKETTFSTMRSSVMKTPSTLIFGPVQWLWSMHLRFLGQVLRQIGHPTKRDGSPWRKPNRKMKGWGCRKEDAVTSSGRRLWDGKDVSSTTGEESADKKKMVKVCVFLDWQELEINALDLREGGMSGVGNQWRSHVRTNISEKKFQKINL
jgi:hypothetical protein